MAYYMVLCMWLLAVDCCLKFAPKVLYIISNDTA